MEDILTYWNQEL